MLQLMLPEVNASVSDAPCSCMIKFGDSMSIFGSDAASPTADPHKLLKLCKDFTLKGEKYRGDVNLDVSDRNVESVLVHVAALGCVELQAQVDAMPAVAVEVQHTAADGLITRATLERDEKFIARKEELARVGCIVEDVFTSIAPAPATCCCFTAFPV
jgi:hypothetical protein